MSNKPLFIGFKGNHTYKQTNLDLDQLFKQGRSNDYILDKAVHLCDCVWMSFHAKNNWHGYDKSYLLLLYTQSLIKVIEKYNLEAEKRNFCSMLYQKMNWNYRNWQDRNKPKEEPANMESMENEKIHCIMESMQIEQLNKEGLYG